MTTILLYIMDGCSHCATLEGWLDAAHILYGRTYSMPAGANFTATPGTVIDGAHFYGYPDCNEECQFTHIKAAVAAATPATATPGATPTGATAESARPTIWSNSVYVIYSGSGAAPDVTPSDWQPPDVSLTPVLPVPPTQPVGLTVALRDPKKAIQTTKV